MLITDRNYGEHMSRLDQHAGPWILDVETTGLKPWMGDRIIGVGIGPLDASIPDAYFPYGHVSGNLSRPIKELLETVHRRRWIGHSAKFEYQMLLTEGFDALRAPKPPICTLVGLHTVDENRPNNGLKPTCAELFGQHEIAASDRLDKLLQDRLLTKGDLARLTAEEAHEYGTDDVRLTRLLFNWIFPRCKHEDTLEVWEGTSEYSALVGRMEYRGVPVDLERVAMLRKRAERACLELLRKARDMRGRPINLDAPQQVAKWLRVKSTTDEVLERMHSPEAELVREYRSWSKAIGSYYKPFQAKHHEGILHPDFFMDGTVSGRLSCANPNLQALARDEEIFGVKGVIVARKGMVWLVADYSQAEVRLVAHYSQDPALLRMIHAGGDSHQYVANEIGVPRQVGKTLNFSVIFGIGAWTLHERLNCSEDQAEAFLRAYHTRYPGFKRVYDTAERMARRYRFIAMWSRRRRHFNRGPYETPYHKASSNLIQGGVGELLRQRQTLVDRALRSEGVEQALQIHDAAAMEVPEEEAPRLALKVREIMEEHKRFRVPFTIDAKWGRDLNCTGGSL